uniref:Lipoprotein n=1 Tax=Arundo donax TaxID=35708 RepID=A0A0A9AZP7_ARUDO
MRNILLDIASSGFYSFWFLFSCSGFGGVSSSCSGGGELDCITGAGA